MSNCINLLEKFSNNLEEADISLSASVATNLHNVQEIPLPLLHSFGFEHPSRAELHCFHPYPQQKLERLAEDIKTHGILEPLIVRKCSDRSYEILAGHNRCAAARLAGKKTAPCYVKEVDDDEAIIIMTSTNLNQRDRLLPSEKAYAYKAQMEAIKKKDYPVPSSSSNEDCRRQIFRYIRLTYLIPPLLEKVDQHCIPFRAGVSLSYLSEKVQSQIYDIFQETKKNIDLKRAILLRQMYENKSSIDRDEVLDIIFPKRHLPTGKTTSIKFETSVLESYFPNQSPTEIMQSILAMLKNKKNGL